LLSHVDIDRDELQAQASKYGVNDVVDDLCNYLDTSGDQRISPLPKWDDFQELAAEYEVAP